ncbi:unnamed protein product [Blepharisma stoltei]|uniref:Tetratricopeptide repeat protein n=1 Tax=Blepharisma stoltei TaxID=1481888 RepID=A0AAU9JSM7_9CILI|nr:unnamed protein product [Blepharisma stoltei]
MAENCNYNCIKMSMNLRTDLPYPEELGEQYLPVIMEGLRKPNEPIDISQALAFFESKTQQDDSEGKHWVLLGHCYFIKQDLDRCYATYQKALHTFKEDINPQLWYGIGLLYWKFGNIKYAEIAFLATLRISPDFEEKGIIYSNLGSIYKAQGNYENAEHYYQKAYGCNTSDNQLKSQLLCHLGQCLELQNKAQEAVKVYRESIRAWRNQEALNYLINLHTKLNDSENVISNSKQLISEKPDNTISSGIIQPIPQGYNPYIISQYIYALYCLQDPKID